MWEVQLEQYKGPLDALLQLIEDRKLPISQINLAQVTGDFLEYLQHATPAHIVPEKRAEYTRLLADFILIASRLVLIKSKSLLPDLTLTQEEERDIQELEERLRVYQHLKPAMRIINRLWSEGQQQFSRPYLFGVGKSFLQSSPHMFYPGGTVVSENLTASLEKLFLSLEKILYEEVAVTEKIRSLEEEMRSVLERLSSLGNINFARLSAERSRGEVIIIFLAILHLARDRSITLDQGDTFAEIVIGTQAEDGHE